MRQQELIDHSFDHVKDSAASITLIEGLQSAFVDQKLLCELLSGKTDMSLQWYRLYALEVRRSCEPFAHYQASSAS
jgi:hypothetical protein